MKVAGMEMLTKPLMTTALYSYRPIGSNFQLVRQQERKQRIQEDFLMDLLTLNLASHLHFVSCSVGILCLFYCQSACVCIASVSVGLSVHPHLHVSRTQ